MTTKTVRVQINGVWTTLTENTSTGKYEGTIAAPNITSFNKPGGYYPVTVEAEDLAGNKTIKSDTDPTLGNKLKLYVKEVTKPTIKITSPSSGAYVINNKIPIKFELRDEVNGSGVKISTLKLNVNGTVLNNVSPGVVVSTVTNGFDVVYTPQSALDDGDHTIKVDVDDNDGNKALQVTRSFTVDTIPPELSITSPSETTTHINKSAFTIVGHTNDLTSSPVTVSVKLNGVDQGAVTVASSGDFTKAITLREGSNAIVIRATDSAGKYSESSYTIILNTVAPTISNITLTPNPVNVNQPYVISVEVTSK